MTAFKKNSEYVIAFLFFVSLILLQKNQQDFAPRILRLMQAALLFNIAAELFFAIHEENSDLPNFIGHLLRIFSFYSIYRAVIETSLTQPYNILFRELTHHKAELESNVQERTAALQKSTEHLQEEITERRRVEQELRWELAVNKALAQISDALLSRSVSLPEIEVLIVKTAKELTGSSYGTTICLKQNQVLIKPRIDPFFVFPLLDESLPPSSTATLKGFYTNSIASHQPHANGQIPYKNYLQVPVVIESNVVAWMVLGDKQGDYKHQDLAAVERLTAVFALSIQRKEMEESLKKSEHKYRSLFNEAPDMIHIVDQHKAIIDANPVELDVLGYTPEEIFGTCLWDIIHPEYRKKTIKTLDLVFNTGECIRNYETALISKNGQQLMVEISAVPQFEQGKVVSVRSIMRNITQRKKEELEKKKLEAQLRQSKKMEAIGTLAGGIAHDFNNILGPILGYTDMAVEALPEKSSLRPWLQEVLRAANRAKELVRQILDISRKTEQEVQPLRIQLVIKEALKLLRSSIPSTIEIRQHLDPSCGAVLADPTRIHQIIMNLCTNAYYAMREKGGVLDVSLQSVELTAEQVQESKLRLSSGSYLLLEVRDTGCGIPPKIIEKIFEPYFTTRIQGEGTGLGLALVQSITLDFGGDIVVSSTLGKGTSFYVYFPTIQAAKEESSSKDKAEIPTGSEHILVVDDDTHFAQMSSKMLESLGYTVTVLHGSTEALAIFEQQPEVFDLVLTDMTMPKITGSDLAKKLLTLCPDLPILLCTGFSQLMDEKRAADLGIYDILMKPFTRRELARTVRDALDRKH
jgi:PAS domain S-box-containing protein